MLEIVLTPKILGPPYLGGPTPKPFQPNGISAPALNTLNVRHCSVQVSINTYIYRI